MSVPFSVTCPFCRKVHNMGFHVDADGVGRKEKPIPGDFVCCVDCNGWSVHDPSAPGNLRQMSGAERIVLQMLRSYQRIESAIQEIDQEDGKKVN